VRLGDGEGIAGTDVQAAGDDGGDGRGAVRRRDDLNVQPVLLEEAFVCRIVDRAADIDR